MEPFIFQQPTRIRLGSGISGEIGKYIEKYGTHCLLVTYHHSKLSSAQSEFNEKIEASLVQVGVKVTRFQGALPNPTTDCVDEGYTIAKSSHIDTVLAVGGGSVIDTAKMIAFRASNADIDWDDLLHDFSTPFPVKEPECKPVPPIIVIPTTSGTGSQVTHAAVITNMKDHQKTSIFHSYLFPKEAVIDPQLMVSVPPHVTGDTGFDAFCHAFESYINKNASPISEAISLEAIRLIFKWLPVAVENGSNLEARENMAVADTLAGISLSAAGATLPHPFGEMIGSIVPQISHGRLMAVIYPDFMRFAAISAVEKFATIGRLLNPRLADIPDHVASLKACAEFDKFLKKIGMWFSFDTLEIPYEDLKGIPEMLSPIAANLSPRAATIDDLKNILEKSKKR